MPLPRQRMRDQQTASPTRFGTLAGFALAFLTAAYAAVLVVGLVTLPSPNHPIEDPWFTLMELLILGIAPATVAFSVGLHAWVPVSNRPVALLAVVFMSMCAAVTSAVHFVILALSRLPSFASPEWASSVFAFRWPSIVYALDILAWDFFFPLGAACAASALRDLAGLQTPRRLLYVSAALAFIGLAGVPLADMRIRNVGIIGYVVLFPLAAALLAAKLRRTCSRPDPLQR